MHKNMFINQFITVGIRQATVRRSVSLRRLYLDSGVITGLTTRYHRRSTPTTGRSDNLIGEFNSSKGYFIIPQRRIGMGFGKLFLDVVTLFRRWNLYT